MAHPMNLPLFSNIYARLANEPKVTVMGIDTMCVAQQHGIPNTKLAPLSVQPVRTGTG